MPHIPGQSTRCAGSGRTLCADSSCHTYLIQVPDVLVLDVLSVRIVPGVLVAEDGLEAVPVVLPVDVGQVEECLPVRPKEVEHFGQAEQVQLCTLTQHGGFVSQTYEGFNKPMNQTDPVPDYRPNIKNLEKKERY